MYTTIIHPIRKALNLSIREYILLDTIYVLSHNKKYSGWCIASKDYIAETLGLSSRWIYSGINKLEEVELIERDSATGYLRTTDLWNEIVANKNDWLIGFNGKESQFVSAKAVQKKLEPETAKNAATLQKSHKVLQELQSDTAESAYNNNKDNNSNNNKTTKVVSDANEKAEYGKKEINDILDAIKIKVGCSGFTETQKWQRIYGNHLFNLMSKLTPQEFSRRLDIILKDSFKRKNCGSLKYLYGQLKGFVEPKSSGNVSYIS